MEAEWMMFSFVLVLMIVCAMLLGAGLATYYMTRRVFPSKVESAVRLEISAWLACMSKHLDKCVLKAFRLRMRNITDPTRWKLYITPEEFAECQKCQITQIDGIRLCAAIEGVENEPEPKHEDDGVPSAHVAAIMSER